MRLRWTLFLWLAAAVAVGCALLPMGRVDCAETGPGVAAMVKVKVFNADGSLRTEIFGAEARHYPDTGRMEIDTARIRAYNDHRQLTVATAKRITSNADHTEFVLEGNAVVIRQAGRDAGGKPTPRMEFHGEYLKVVTPRDIVYSNRPVEIIRGTDRIMADELYYRGDRQRGRLAGSVRMQLQPRKP